MMISMNSWLWVIVCSICVSIHATQEIVLLDTRNARDYLNWLKISSNGRSHDGWGELSFEAKQFPTLLISSLSSTLWRTQYVCDITSDRRVDHWLRSPYIKREQAQRIEIELGFSIRDCSTFQTPNEIRTCRETFELYIKETDEEEKHFQSSYYQLVDTIAGNRFTSNNFANPNSSISSNLTVNVKNRGISIEKQGFYLGFRDQGACVSLLYVKVFYRQCEPTDQGLVHFEQTPTGASLTDIIERDGQCAVNSKMIRRPLAFCKGNGQWTFQDILLRDSCQCQEGYELLIENHHHDHHDHQPSHEDGNTRFRAVCKACPIGTFKSMVTNEQICQPCPSNSFTRESASAFCLCHPGFFRLNSSSLNSACITHPKEPGNVTINDLDQVSVQISWTGSNDTYYHVQCHHLTPCESYVIYYPRQRFLIDSKIRLIGLDSDRTYQVKIYAEHISTKLLSKSVHFAFTTTRAIVRFIRRVQYRRLTFNTVLISWSSEDFDQFHLRYWSPFDPSKKTLIVLAHNNYTLTLNDDQYMFQIRAHFKAGWTHYTPEQVVSLNSAHFDEMRSEEASKSVIENRTILLMGPMSILSLIIMMIILGLLYSKKKRVCRLKTASDCQSLDYQKRNANGHYGLDSFLHSSWNSPIWPLNNSSRKIYVDPHTYEDPNKAVTDFARELDPNLIVIDSVIGGGEFGDVCRGKLKRPAEGTELIVAIKTLKQGANEKTRLDFLSEASIMGQFRHENVIYLEGVVTKRAPIMIITEFMENGSLDAFLRSLDRNKRLDSLQLTRMLHGIASGMKYLSEMKYVHRDLAARNILVNRNLTCKVADFGLSREIDEGEFYTTKGGKIPIRWTSIEAIDYRKFTSASDVWSFGIVCWEVTSFGERPYWNWTNQDVIKSIKKFYRLPAPPNCPKVLYQLMLNCWDEDYLKRLKFREIEAKLKELIEDSNLLLSTLKKRSTFINDPQKPNFAQVTSIVEWLESIGLERVEKSFLQFSYKNLSQISHFDGENLLKILENDFSRDERIRFLDALKNLRSRLILASTNSLLIDEGFLV